jgi:hypothetical protein
MPEEMHDAGPRRYFWTPRMPLAVYAAYLALLFSFGHLYPLVPWPLIGAVALGVPALFIITRAVRTLPRSRLWFSSGTNEETQGGRPGLRLLLIVVLTGPAPFLLSAAVQHWLSGAGVGTTGLQVTQLRRRVRPDLWRLLPDRSGAEPQGCSCRGTAFIRSVATLPDCSRPHA